uniref:Secreted protein n=1 Tax=Ixodes ricinus TaxID=34613 RepID=A0A6B0UIH1_IXORI
MLLAFRPLMALIALLVSANWTNAKPRIFPSGFLGMLTSTRSPYLPKQSRSTSSLALNDKLRTMRRGLRFFLASLSSLVAFGLGADFWAAAEPRRGLEAASFT